MSCYRIEYRDGKKVMIPVNSREEYLQLRGSRRQKELLKAVRGGNTEAKRQLMQFNYSCIPGEDGLLKGCTQMSDTIGMDVDHIEPKLMAEVGLRILDMKDELGLMMLEKSARGQGYHLVMKRKEYMSQEENLQWASKKLGVEYDKGAKDITRVFFASTEEQGELIYLDPMLFRASPPALPRREGAANASKAPQAAPFLPSGHPFPQGGKESDSNDAKRDLSTEGMSSEGTAVADVTNPLPPRGNVEEVDGPKGKVKGPGKGALLAFDLCVKQAGLDPQKMDVWGQENWHNNLMAVMSVGVAKLMSKEQLLAVVAERLPNYSKYEDCTKLINYFYENYQADKGFMSAALRKINSLSQTLPRREGLAGAEPAGEGMNVTNSLPYREGEGGSLDDSFFIGWTPPTLPKKLPRLVDLEVRNYDAKYREALVQSSVVGHSGLASHFRARYINNKVVTPATMVSVIGGSGSGKDNCTQLFNDQMRHTIEETERMEWEKVRANSDLREKMRNAKECPPKYHPKIRIFESASKTSLLELQSNLGENGMLVGIFSEADGYVGATSAGWSNLSVMFRKGYSGEKHRQFYMSDTTCNTSTSLNISLLIEGTPKAILERMFNEKNCENGTMQRFAPVLMPKKKRTFRPPLQNFLTDDEVRERDALLMELYQKDLALGDDTLMIETPKMNNAIGHWFDTLEERYNDGELTEAEADLSHRCGEFMLKAALPLIVLYGETKEVIDYAVWVGDMAFYNMCHIYGHRVQDNIQASNDLLSSRIDARKTAEPLLDKMPTVFNLKQFKEQRLKDGQSTEVKMLLSRYCKNGKLERIGRGVYRKMAQSEK